MTESRASLDDIPCASPVEIACAGPADRYTPSMSSVATESPAPVRRPGTSLRGFSAPLVLLVGVVVIPFVLTVATTPSSAPTDADYVRMAFASVAGATIAIASALGLLIDRVIRRAKSSTIAIFALVALVAVPYQLSAIQNAADLLLARLGA
jgi:hypothetical protein